MELSHMQPGWHEEIYTKGFVILNEPDLYRLIGMDEDFQLLNKEERLRDNSEKDMPQDLAKRFKMAAQYLQYKYVEPVWPNSEYRKFVVWEGVDKDNQLWHTDLFEDLNLFFLFYFDDTHPETGGAIYFKWGENTFKFQPQRGDLILVSNRKGFFHRADASTIRRRVASFDFQVEGKL
jgi:hypothetical protein